MIFCLGEGKCESKGAGYQKNSMIFNKKVDNFEDIKNEYNKIGIKIPLTEYIFWSKMSDKQKKEYPEAEQKGGTLIVRKYQEAWGIWWNNNKGKQGLIKALPHFDSEIFKKITGIDVDKKRTIVINNKEIEVSEDSYNEFKKQFKK